MRYRSPYPQVVYSRLFTTFSPPNRKLPLVVFWRTRVVTAEYTMDMTTQYKALCKRATNIWTVSHKQHGGRHAARQSVVCSGWCQTAVSQLPLSMQGLRVNYPPLSKIMSHIDTRQVLHNNKLQTLQQVTEQITAASACPPFHSEVCAGVQMGALKCLVCVSDWWR